MSVLSDPLNANSVALGDWLAATAPGCGTPDLVTDHPWAQTFRVPSSAGIYYVKVLPPPQRSAMEAMGLLSKIFQSKVPEVVASSPDHGLLLLKDHGGQSIHRSDAQTCSPQLLALYADLQSEAARHPELLSVLPTLNFTDLIPHFIAYFDDTPANSDRVGAAHFLGQEAAHFYRDRLQLRLPLVQNWLEQAQLLPPTINHCDLRIQNAAQRPDGTLVLFDWDDSLVAPAGMSLHNFFSGCSLPFAVLQDLPRSRNCDSHHRYLLDTYVEHLATGNYANRDTLQQALPGAICAGVMNYLMSYGKFPLEDAEDREVVAKIIRRRTDDLLVLCDQLAMSDRTRLITHVEDYAGSAADDRASQTLRDYVQLKPSDWEMQWRLANHLWHSGSVEEAETVCRRALAAQPTEPALRRLLGEMALEQLDIDAAIDHWTIAQQFSQDQSGLRHLLLELEDIRLHLDTLDQPQAVPKLRVSHLDADHGCLARFKLRLAARLFREFGTLVLENVFASDLLDDLHRDFLERYWPQLKGGNPTGSLQVGNGRFMTTLEISGVFNDDRLYAAPFMMKLLGRLLGDGFTLGSFTSVASLPGAPDMRMHKDHPALFSSDELSHPLPTFAVTMLLPLLGLNAEMGTTRVVKRSHRTTSAEASKMDFQDPLGPPGSCLLMDYRLSHQGLANRSQVVRPVLSLVYNRPWFRDAANYKKQVPVDLPAAEFERVPPQHQCLFDWLFPNIDR